MKARGFTLIELMLVVAIVGLLVAIALPKFSNLIDKSREAAAKGNIGALRSALSIYYADNEGIYPLYGIPFSLTWGMLELDGKYIDLTKVIFNQPRYLHAGSGGSANAKELFAMALNQNNDFGGIPHLNWVVDRWPVAYSCWAVNMWDAPATMAELRSTCPHPDLSGRAWSLN
jgi:prepilin-type N-terminal cleavage/methylation domain-containing protein